MLPVPPAGCVDVWWLDIGTVTVGRPELAELSLEEHKRAASFAFRSDRRRYTAAHVMLRRVLSGYVDIPPSSLIFRREPCPRCGKPTGRQALPFGYGLHFSLAHSGDAVVIAVAGQQVGVDVEQQPTGCVCALSADMNAADAEWGRPLGEAAGMTWSSGGGCGPRRCSSAPARASATASARSRCWAARTGRSARPCPAGPDQLMAATPAHGCSLISLPAPDGYQAALALAGSVSGIRLAIRAPWTAAAARRPSRDSVR